MNQLTATVTSIEATDVVTYVDLECSDEKIRVIKAKAPSWLSIGDEVKCSFQEASVCVSKECPGKVSIENRVSATLKEVRNAQSLCELTFDSPVGKVVALITADAYDELGLEKDCKATMLLRAVDINLDPILKPMNLAALAKRQQEQKMQSN